MSKINEPEGAKFLGTSTSVIRNFKLIDFLVLVFFIFTAMTGLYLFRQDLMRTFEARDADPVGIIIVRNNIVQRRHDDRTVWERLFEDSPVYSGDLIRAADISSATINLFQNNLGLNENSIIRIQQLADRRAAFEVELREGNLVLTSAEDDNIALFVNLMGNHVQAAPGSTLNAETSQDGIVVQVSEGSATIVNIEQGNVQEINEGSMIARDPMGVERIFPAAVISRPLPNSVFLNDAGQPVMVNFSWNRVNLEADDTLRLEFADDRNFHNILYTVDDLKSSSQAAFDSGLWHWRLMFEERVLGRGQFTVLDAFGPALQSPVLNSVFRFQGELPQVRFQWAAVQGASHYILEISGNSDFETVLIRRQTSATSVIQSDIKEGTWYWRVLPVFPPVFIGSAAHSHVFSFSLLSAPADRTADTPALHRALVEIPAVPAVPAVQAVTAAVVTEAQPAAAVIRRRRVAETRRYHTIQSGDTLGRLAMQFYGDPLLWTRIAETNNIANPDLIFPGQVFLIP